MRRRRLVAARTIAGFSAAGIVSSKTQVSRSCMGVCGYCSRRLLWKTRKPFAVLTNDTDFFVYGVERIVLINDLTIVHRSVTLVLRNSNACWRLRRVKNPPGAVSALQRAQFAALMGNDCSKDIRKRMENRFKRACRR